MARMLTCRSRMTRCHGEQSHGLLKRLTEVGETTGKLKLILGLTGLAIGAVAKWLGM